jgi:hypothetical protein
MLQGGPIDCCKYKYSGSGSKCQWGGTPVSFTLVGTCSADGKTYQTLSASNSQGPPGQPNCRCKDPVPAPQPQGCPSTVCNSYFANAMVSEQLLRYTQPHSTAARVHREPL